MVDPSPRTSGWSGAFLVAELAGKVLPRGWSEAVESMARGASELAPARRARGIGTRLRAGAATDIGRVRELNEDVYISRPDEGLFVVCDGMGGCPAGEVASQMAAETIQAGKRRR